MAINILRLPVILKMRGRSRSAHYSDIQQGLYIRPVSIGPRAKGYPDYEADQLNAARIAGYSDEEIRALVKALEAARTVAKPQ